MIGKSVVKIGAFGELDLKSQVVAMIDEVCFMFTYVYSYFCFIYLCYIYTYILYILYMFFTFI